MEQGITSFCNTAPDIADTVAKPATWPTCNNGDVDPDMILK